MNSVKHSSAGGCVSCWFVLGQPWLCDGEQRQIQPSLDLTPEPAYTSEWCLSTDRQDKHAPPHSTQYCTGWLRRTVGRQLCLVKADGVMKFIPQWC